MVVTHQPSNSGAFNNISCILAKKKKKKKQQFHLAYKRQLIQFPGVQQDCAPVAAADRRGISSVHVSLSLSVVNHEALIF